MHRLVSSYLHTSSLFQSSSARSCVPSAETKQIQGGGCHCMQMFELAQQQFILLTSHGRAIHALRV